MRTIKVSAPGKLHLLGEHSVVYGKPAIIAAVNKRCFVEIIPRNDKTIEIDSKNFTISQKFEENEILAKTLDARKKWHEFTKTNDTKILTSVTKETLDYPIIIIGETFLYYKKNLPSGFTLRIDSEIPIGSGMGSSAALAVSVAGALSVFAGEPLDKENINNIAFLSEQKKHGFPSGGDNAASCYGGLLWYRKETNELNIIKPLSFKLSETLQKHFFIINTGTPIESTGEMVSKVKTIYKTRPAFCEKIFNDQEYLVRELLFSVKNGNKNAIIRIIKNGEKNLEKLGVVSPYVKSLIRKIENVGGAAKICGAGGRKLATGIILGFLNQPKESISQTGENYFYETIQLGIEGIRMEVN